MKHGLYMAAVQPEDVENLEEISSRIAVEELILARITLRRMSKYIGDPDLAQADLLAIVPPMSTMMRTVIRLLNKAGDSFDWDEVLDELGEEWGMDL